MPIEIGTIEALFRYPVKSMRGQALDAADLGWHGLEGDRRLAFRRLGDHGGFPWLSASKLPELMLFTPHGMNGDSLPTHVRTPEGEDLPTWSEALDAEIGRRHGAPVQLTHLRNGIFDDASISVITSGTIGEVCRLAGVPADMRRFRPNIVVRSRGAVAFEENGWVGGVLTFGGGDEAPAVAVTARDLRCMMVNLDPGDARSASEVLRVVSRANASDAGVYSTVTRSGRLAIGQTVLLHR